MVAHSISNALNASVFPVIEEVRLVVAKWGKVGVRRGERLTARSLPLEGKVEELEW